MINKILGGLFWSFFNTGAGSVLSILVLIFLARLLTPEDFGIVNAALVVTGISTIFAQLGVGSAVIQRKNLELRHLITANTLSLLLGFFLAILIYFFSSDVSSFFRMPGLIRVLQPLSLILIFEGASTVPRSLLHRELKFKILAFVNLFSYFFGYGIVGIILALLHAGVWALVAALLTKSLIEWILLLKLQAYPKAVKIEKKAFRELSDFGTGFTLASIFNYLARNGDYLIIGRFLGAEKLGLYSRAYKIMTLPATIFSNVADIVIFPVMAKIQDSESKLQLGYKKNIAIISLLSLPTSIAMFILAPEIITVLLGKKWEGAIIPFKILSIGAFFRASYKISESIARAKGSVYKIAFSQGIYCFLIIAGAWVGQHWGIIGVSWGVLFALFSVFFLLSWIGIKITRLNFQTFAAIHLPSMRLTIIFSVELFALAYVLRAYSLAPLTIAMICASAIVVTVFFLYRMNRVFFLGESGVWFIHSLSDFFSQKFPRIVYLIKNYK